MAFGFRGLELHGRRMWDRTHILRALDEIERRQLTALVLHETDMMNHVLFPRAFFDPYAAWSGAPPRRGENAIQNNRVWLDTTLRLAASRGIPVWLEVKELAFPDEVLELRPDLVKDGIICPSDPFWWEFLEKRTAELYADFPLVAGLIVSPGSPEGRASRAQDKCGCAHCAATPLKAWYKELVGALHRPSRAAGKPLAVREFAYKPKDQVPLLAAIDELPEDIILCAKVTPHDFYPTFPHNPAIARRPRPMWVEYDVHGQFFGWGLLPCLVRQDIADRFAHAAAHGVDGTVLRVEWERVNDLWALETPNRMNLIAAAALAAGETPDDEQVCRTWLTEEGLDPAAAPWLASIMARTWPLVRGALYLGGHVFADCSMFPRSMGRAFWTMERKHSVMDWDASRRGELDADAARCEAFVAEKQAAIAEASAIRALLDTPPAGLAPATVTTIRHAFRHMETHVRGLALCAEASVRARCVSADVGGEAMRRDLAACISKLDRFATEIEALAAGQEPHQMVMLIDHRRARDVMQEAVAVGRVAS
jgi:hypothetical protein